MSAPAALEVRDLRKTYSNGVEALKGISLAVTVAIFAFLNSWNEFLAALVLLSDNSKFTLPILITAVRAGRLGAIDWGAVQAGVTVMSVPCLFVFLLLQRYYMRGLMAGAVK